MTDDLFGPGVALVVGGSGGIGRAICRALARDGADVAITYRTRAEAAEATAEDVRAAGRDATVVRLDLADTDSIARALASHDAVHTVVYAAGPDLPMPYLSRATKEDWARVVDADVHGFFHLVQAAIPHLRATRGALVAVSTAGLDRHPHRDALSVAPKAAVEALVRATAVEEGRFGVRANAVRVGVVEAGMFLRLRDEGLDPAWIDAAKQRTPLGRFGTADEVAHAVAFLASRRASYITGQSLTVDGGWSA